MRLLLVGAGYLGNKIRELITADTGHSLLACLVNSQTSADELQQLGAPAAICDISDPNAVHKVTARLVESPDLIIQCVTSARGTGATGYRSVYLDGIRNLRHSFPDSRILFVSSTSVYAQTDGRVVDENSPAQPDRETGQILLDTEQQALASGGCVARLAGLYGPGRSVLLDKFLNDTAIIENKGSRIINQIHRDDAAAAITKIASVIETNTIYNVADDTPLTQLEFYSKLATLLSRPLPPSGPRDLNRKRGWTSKAVSNQKLRALGWQPNFPSYFDALDTSCWPEQPPRIRYA